MTIAIGTSWSLYSASFTAAATANDGRLEFWVGDVAGNVWLDGVALSADPPEVDRRDFSNGIVLLNGESTPQTMTLEAGFQRFKARRRHCTSTSSMIRIPASAARARGARLFTTRGV